MWTSEPTKRRGESAVANKRRFSDPVLTSIKLESVEQQLLNIYGIPLGDLARVGIQAGIEKAIAEHPEKAPVELIDQFYAIQGVYQLQPTVRRVKSGVEETISNATTTAVTQCEHITVWDMDFDRRETIPAHKFNPAIHRRISVEVEPCLN